MSGEYLFQMDKYLRDQGLRYDDAINDMVAARENGKEFLLQEHIAGLVYALLTNQTRWSRIVPHLSEIDELFHHYDPAFIKSKPGSYFEDGLYGMKCGNMSTGKQMDALARNVETFERIVAEYGSMDAFITTASPYRIVKKLANSSSKYKLRMVGEALAWEYIRNVGIDGCKPDTHLRRFLGKARMGVSRKDIASVEETLHQVDTLAEATGLRLSVIDNLIWSFCADGYGQVCTDDPHCDKCVIRDHCHRMAAPDKAKNC